MMINVDDVTENFNGCKTLRNKINDLENKLRLRNVRLENNHDGVEVTKTVMYVPPFYPPRRTLQNCFD